MDRLSPCAELDHALIERARAGMVCEPAPLDAWVWRTDFSENRCASLLELLSADERAKAARFRFAADRVRSIVARAGLRLLLGTYLEKPPAALRFEATEEGKPGLIDSAISFNLAHSGRFAAAVISRGRDVGIDLEEIRPGAALQDVARRFYTPEELAWLQTRTGDWLESFFRLWVAKEAVLKASGTGLAVPPDRIHIRLGEDCPPWRLREFKVAAGYAAAVAFSGPPAEVELLTRQLRPLQSGS